MGEPELEYVRCNLCQQDETQIFLSGSGPLKFVRCRHDALLYMNPRPRMERVRQFHTQFVRASNLDYFSGHRRDVLRREANAIKAIKQGGTLLDVGCATGTLFENFSSRTWQLYGVDTSSVGVDLAQKNHKAQVFCGTVRETTYPSNFFDVITLLDTLYYCPDPYSELVELRRILKDDGTLAIEIPGYKYSLIRDKGLVCWLLDRTWIRGFMRTRHLYYFSPRCLRLLLEKAGFKVVRVLPEQASLGRTGLLRFLNELHFALARALFWLTKGGLSIAAKEFYLAVKHDCTAKTVGS